MALILTIDTAIDKAIICFSKNGEVLCSAENTTQKEHASFVHVAIKNLCIQYKIGNMHYRVRFYRKICNI